MLIRVIVFLVLSSLALEAISENPSPIRYNFRLESGSDKLVCRQYTNRLNQSDFQIQVGDSSRPHYPACDRPETDAVDGFASLTRRYLDLKEFGRLYARVEGFLRGANPNYFAEKAALLLSLGRTYSDGSQYHSNKYREALEREEARKYHYTYEEDIDIDNDGIADEIVIWKKPNIWPCGRADKNGFPRYQPTHVLLLDSEGSFDHERTKLIFQHPAGPTWAYTDQNGETQELTSPPYRTLGYGYGIFKHENVFYYDTFYAPTGDFYNKRVGDRDIHNLLAVLKRDKNRTELVCEIRLLNPPGSIW